MQETIRIEFSSEKLDADDLRLLDKNRDVCEAVMKYLKRQIVLGYQNITCNEVEFQKNKG